MARFVRCTGLPNVPGSDQVSIEQLSAWIASPPVDPVRFVRVTGSPNVPGTQWRSIQQLALDLVTPPSPTYRVVMTEGLTGIAGARTVTLQELAALLAALVTLDFSKVFKFGDSIDEFEFDTGASEAARQTGLIMRMNGGGELGAAMSLDPRVTFEVYNDVTNTGPVFNANVPKYYSGQDVSYAGATVPQLLTLATQAAQTAQLLGCGIVIIGGGTNSVPWSASTQTDHLAIIDAFLGVNPNFKIGCENIRPIGVSRVDANRTKANIDASNVLMDANIAARASRGVQKIDVNGAYAQYGNSGTAPDVYYLGDYLHLSARGGAVGAVPTKAFIAANAPAAATPKIFARRLALMMTAGLDNMAGTPVAANAPGGSGTGTVTGTKPANVDLVKVGSVNSNTTVTAPATPQYLNGLEGIADNTLAHPGYRGGTGRMLAGTTTTVSGNATESYTIRPTASKSLVASTWANTWGEFYCILRVNDPNGILRTAVLNALERSNTANNYTQRSISLYKDNQGAQRVYLVYCNPLKGASTSTGHQLSFTFVFDSTIAGSFDWQLEYWCGQTRGAPAGTT